MQRTLLALFLFIAQVYLTLRGAHHFSKYWNPVLLLAVSIGIAWTYYRYVLVEQRGTAPHYGTAPVWKKGLGALIGAFSFVLTYEELRKLCTQWSPPVKYSDVLPQLEALYYRFARGEFPYAPVHLETHDPYPVYMPLHWLPIGISDFLNIDTRWSGLIVLGLAAAFWGWYVMSQQGGALWEKVAIILLPSLSLWGYIRYGEVDIPVSYELIIAAYYLLLAVAIRFEKLGWITLALICCLLSRYTLVFWVPFFAVVVWKTLPRRVSYGIWGTVAFAFLVFYFLPFISQDPGILTTGVKYHNGAAEAEWLGWGEEGISWTMERGVHFALYLKEYMQGTPQSEVYVARIIQAGFMLFLMGLGFYLFFRHKHKYSPMGLSLLMLYLFVFCFYTFGPLTYRYYLIVLHMLSAVLCGAVVIAGFRKPIN